ncbi:PIN domain-containing protein [Moraxella marmotae]|uniref:PIN domain-containing protein n=1 Tax=Moraxella marmotae TaxID=3344520 RepID=UPI0035D4281B
MYLLDTNILSELMRPNPSLVVVDWLDNYSPLFISSITQAELLTGALLMADGKKKIALFTLD